MQHDLRLQIFWIAAPVLLGLFGLEMAYIGSVWLKARVPGLPADAPRLRKLRTVLARLPRILLGRHLWAALGALIRDGLLQRKLYRTSARRWLTHALVFGPWLVLGVFSTLTGFVVEILPLAGMTPDAIAALPVLGQLYHADVWWVALTNEVFGLAVLAGMALVIHRRYVQRDPQLRSAPMDHLIIALLALIVLSGFPTETVRLLADYTTPAGAFAPDPGMLPPHELPAALRDVWGPQWAFAGYLSAKMLGLLGWGPGVWHVLHNVLFWGHVATGVTLLFLLPFSRFFHAIMSPLIVVWNNLPDDPLRAGPPAPRRRVPGV